MIAKHFTFLFLLLVALTSCESKPKELIKRENDLHKKIVTLSKTVKEKELKYLELTSNPEEDFSYYAESEDWREKYIESKEKLKQATNTYNSMIQSHYNNKTINKYLDYVEKLLNEAESLADYPLNRLYFMKEAKKNFEVWVVQAQKDYNEIINLISEIEIVVNKTKFDFPAKAAEIDDLYAPLRTKRDDSLSALTKALAELKKYKMKGIVIVDYDLLKESTDKIARILSQISTEDVQIRSKLKELYQSYEKILFDMRKEYWIIVARGSWDESEFTRWPTEHIYIYRPRQVDEETYKYFTGLPSEEIIAQVRQDLSLKIPKSDLSLNIPKEKWDLLNIDPNENVPENDKDSDFWIENYDIKAYHKYIVISNDEYEETDWILVDDEDYEEFTNEFGMAIESKQYGEFELEKNQEAAPPLISFVNNEKYGKWVLDETGRTFWHWYGKFTFIRNILTHNYERNEYEYWKRSFREKKLPYYGISDSGRAKYGTYGEFTRTSSKFANTNFVRSGGFKAADMSIREAGPGGRAGGPGGSGK